MFPVAEILNKVINCFTVYQVFEEEALCGKNWNPEYGFCKSPSSIAEHGYVR